MRVGFLQFNPILGDVDANLAQIENLLRAGPRGDLIVLPELCLSGYALGSRRHAEELAVTADSVEMERLRALCDELGGQLVVGFVEGAGKRIFNAAALIDGGGVRRVWRKTHLFWDEPDLFDPGDSGFVCAQARGATVGGMICFDWLFPECAGTLARKGAQIIVHPANLILPYAFRAMPVRALENRVFTVTCNRWGREGELVFRGGSLIAAPDGSVLAQDESGADNLTVVEIDPAQADDKWITPRNHLQRDRRTDFFS